MKTASLVAIVSTCLLASVGAASESHDIDRGLESNLRSTVNDRHVHVHVDHGIVTVDGRVKTETDRQRIEGIIRNTAGVVAVKDQLKVTLPSPGVYGGTPTTMTTIPVYASAPPQVITSGTIVATPSPVIVPDFPKLRVQAASEDDLEAAERVAHQLHISALPVSAVDSLTIMVRNGTVSLQGVVDSAADRDAVITAVQRAGGFRAIYDQMVVR